jgi:hypothetical protein
MKTFSLSTPCRDCLLNHGVRAGRKRQVSYPTANEASKQCEECEDPYKARLTLLGIILTTESLWTHLAIREVPRQGSRYLFAYHDNIMHETGRENRKSRGLRLQPSQNIAVQLDVCKQQSPVRLGLRRSHLPAWTSVQATAHNHFDCMKTLLRVSLLTHNRLPTCRQAACQQASALSGLRKGLE